MGPAPKAPYHYKIKIDTVDNPVAFKEIHHDLEAMFDIRPVFDDVLDEITIDSEIDMSEERLTLKLNSLGYTLAAYSKTTDYRTPK